MNNHKVALCFRLLAMLTLSAAVTGLRTAMLAAQMHHGGVL